MQTKTIAVGDTTPYLIPAGKALAVSTANDDSVLQYWWTSPNHDDVYGGKIEGAGSVNLGPYIADAYIRVECLVGNAVIEDGGPFTQEPIPIANYVGGLSLAQQNAIASLTSESTTEDIVAALQAS